MPRLVWLRTRSPGKISARQKAKLVRPPGNPELKQVWKPAATPESVVKENRNMKKSAFVNLIIGTIGGLLFLCLVIGAEKEEYTDGN